MILKLILKLIIVAENFADSDDTKGAEPAMVNNSGDSDVAINNAAPVKVIKAACSNHAMPVIHAPPAQGTNSARSTHILPIIHIPIVTGIGTDGGGADAAPGAASAARTNEKSDGGTPRNH